MKTLWSKILMISFAGTALLLGGCGNMSKPGKIIAPASTFSPGGIPGDLSAASSDEYVCPATPNVLADYDFEFNGSGTYTVCQSQNLENIEIHGKTAQSNTICVFPIQYVNEQNIYWKPELATGRPLSSCITVNSTAGVYATFPGITFNAVFIVENTDRWQMEQCLITGTYATCPHYSYGKFR
ncbi:MAG TPA: hypothetical protein DCS07_11220 [Bdellovibrionales bacterium]|nr:MAG: hypothetical protein A2Z97_14500 [Bdellovibrionales bacterium GWB1_52_6]OFZ05959.1 MAG: hypothetical protein A2X97_01310 [Bdellovibrionales bacterium GWA1_52_35]OFZ35679.1 MAG: hypothetical protein A2070_02290 [Bdellovibrionales bacterium GWC1_52_8]HAR43178.1 hypothetical protein [Bdellovibrionales bacterium]HCM39422.1 hypothetical protein [Bdellovibrionales bacterium]